MVAISVELRNLPSTEAAMGWAGSHTLVADRPEGKAGGMGLGFNGGQLLALAIGGCFCNDLRYAAHDLGVDIDAISVNVTIELEGEPLIASSAVMDVACTTSDGTDPASVVERAKTICTVSNSVMRGFPVAIQTCAGTEPNARR